MLLDQLSQIESSLSEGLDAVNATFSLTEIGTVVSIAKGITTVTGLPNVQSQELLVFASGDKGIAFTLEEHLIGVVMLTNSEDLTSGMKVNRTGRVVDVPVGYGLLGRVVSPDGSVLDDLGQLNFSKRWPIEREAPAIVERAPVFTPLETGIKVIDALIPVGRGQRELILGDRQTGKTTVALDTLINQRDKNMICVYCAIGQRSSSVAKSIEVLKQHNALSMTVVVVASGDEEPGLQYIAPYAATSIAEYFMSLGEDVLIVYDDLTHHARAYREMSLLLRRPPGREAFPGDVFYLHSRLLERSTHLCKALGGGSLTALPILETEAGNIAAYIATNLISITDGQIYLSPELFSKGLLPAIDVGKSVSRVGGKTQLPAYRAVTASLRLSYAQFEELETFARFGTRLDDNTRHAIERGQRVREVLKQKDHAILTSGEQLIILLALSHGRFDDLALSDVSIAEKAIRAMIGKQGQDFIKNVSSGKLLQEQDEQFALKIIDNALIQAGLRKLGDL